MENISIEFLHAKISFSLPKQRLFISPIILFVIHSLSSNSTIRVCKPKMRVGILNGV